MRKQIQKSYHPLMSRHSHQIINHSKHHLFFRQKTKKTTTLRAQPVDSDKNFFLKMKSSEALSSLRRFLDQQGGSVSSPSNTWPTEPRIFCSKFLAPGEGNQTCQVRGGTSPPPLPSVDYHTGVVGIKWSLATVIGPSNYVTN